MQLPGRSAQVVAETVAAPIEQQVNGVEDMLYMSSQSTNDGSYTLTVTFKPGVDLNLAQVLVQNRVSLAMPLLPEVVRQTGVTTRKRSPDILMTVSINSPDLRYDQLYLSNYAFIRIRDELVRLPGISEVLVFGQRDYSMRIWLDPDKLAVRNLTVSDVVAALREQNAHVALGQIGQPPAVDGQVKQMPLAVRGRLMHPEEFENIVIKFTADRRSVRIRDVGRVELGARSEDISNRFDLKPTVGLAVFQLPDANALDTADSVQAKMAELAQDFPEGVVYEIGYDTTPYIRESVREVFKSLRDAVILVALVVLVFLQGWRASIIPLVAVPVAIIGTFAAMAVVGFSLNNLTLFGLVLAIGIVVDDAIVVVEAVEYHIEHGLAPRRRHPRHGRSRRTGHRRGARAFGRIHSLRVHLGHRGAVLSAIRLDDRHFDRDFDDQLVELESGACGAPAAAATRQEGLVYVDSGFAARLVFPRLQPGRAKLDERVCRRGRQAAARAGDCARGLRRPPVLDVLGLSAIAERIHSRAGQRLPRGQRAVARCHECRADQPDDGKNRADRQRDSRRQERELRGRQFVLAERLRFQLRLDVHHSRKLRRAAHARAAPPMASSRYFASGWPKKCQTHWSTSSRPLPFRAWGARADSS